MKNYILFLLSIAVFTFSSCKNKKEADASGDTEVVASRDSLPDIKLYTLDGGTVMVNNLELFAQDSVYRGQSKEFADAFYVIEHPKGTLLWDGGLAEGLVAMGAPYTSPDGNFTVSRSDSLVTQLATLGMSVSDIEYLAMSHSHFDHSGHAEAVPEATWLVQSVEYDWVLSPEMEAGQPDMFNAVNDLTNVQKLDGDYDVFGDGTVMIKSLPGHTPGHQVLYVNLKEHGPVLLSGDLYHTYENREFKRIPKFNVDVEQTLKSMEAFEAFAEETGAKVYIQHSKDDFNKMPKAPQYLK